LRYPDQSIERAGPAFRGDPVVAHYDLGRTRVAKLAQQPDIVVLGPPQGRRWQTFAPCGRYVVV
jgi:hypothetical protein